jgi:hypothetical protein
LRTTRLIAEEHRTDKFSNWPSAAALIATALVIAYATMTSGFSLVTYFGLDRIPI